MAFHIWKVKGHSPWCDVWAWTGCKQQLGCLSCAAAISVIICFSLLFFFLLVFSALAVNTRKKKCSLSTVGHRCQTMMWTEPQPNLTVFLFWPQEQSASAPTSGIWPATALFLFSTCAGNTWPRSCALWVTSTRWPAFHFVMSCLLWSRMSISTGVGFHTDSTSQENIRVHLCATCVSLYQWGWLFIPPPPEQKMNASSFQKSWNTVWHVNGNWMQIISGYIQLKQKKDSMSKVIWKNVFCFSIWCQQHIQESCSLGHTSRSRYSFLENTLKSLGIDKTKLLLRTIHSLLTHVFVC